jgi:hypothetical protein
MREQKLQQKVKNDITSAEEKRTQALEKRMNKLKQHLEKVENVRKRKGEQE